MNTKIRFLVLDARNQPVSPANRGLKLGGLTQSGKSPSFLTEEAATKFAQLIAGQDKANYYVARVTTAVSGADNLDAMLADGDRRTHVATVPTTADGNGDE